MAYFNYTNTIFEVSLLEQGKSLRSLNKKRMRCMKKDFAVRGGKLNSHYDHTL